MKLRIAQCTPLVFSSVRDPLATSMQYTQRFSIYDTITVQSVASFPNNVNAWLYKYNPNGDELISMTTCTKVNFGDGRHGNTVSYTALDEGFYRVLLTSVYTDIIGTEFFQVCRPTELRDMLFFEYSNDGNSAMDNIFSIGGTRKTLQFRIEGGIKPSGWTGNVAQETWRTQRQELRVLYSMPYDKWTLTIGAAAGVPVEYIRIVNNILSCNIVYINGRRWCRSEGSVPEKQLTMTGAQMFTATVEVEPQDSLDNYPLELYQVGDEFNNDYNNDYDI